MSTVSKPDEAYLLNRMAVTVAQARGAASSSAKLAYFELAGRYSVAAVAARQRV